jgi:hypothetical protein
MVSDVAVSGATETTGSTQERAMKQPRRTLPMNVRPWTQDADPQVKLAILKQNLRRLAQWGYELSDILEAWEGKR